MILKALSYLSQLFTKVITKIEITKEAITNGGKGNVQIMTFNIVDEFFMAADSESGYHAIQKLWILRYFDNSGKQK